ncbi:hypothetical protein VKT23_002765 [Stygiomarasmius scandens]|uniref:Ubiquitin-like protease family profile domain-containing protein n=1 Tax=Marasmiellus scandens TaxID=2682957 RepID=A0ABR1JV80_9AGAR
MSRPDPQFETAVGLEYPDEYIPGDPSKGKITIEFNDKHSKWSRAKYDNFCQFLERNTGCQRQENHSTAINRGSDKSRLQPARQEGAQGDMDLQTTEVASEMYMFFNYRAHALIQITSSILSFPANTQGAIQILAGDLARLNPGQYLNDNLIEFGLSCTASSFQYVLLQQIEDAKKVYRPGFLYIWQLTFWPQSTIEQQFANIQHWTKHVDIFEKDFLVVPIHEQHHWYLAIVWQPGLMVNAESDEGKTTVTQILTLDSLGQKHSDVIGRLSEYLRLAGRDKTGSDVAMKPVGQQLCVPIQDNGCDCGIYMLHFVKTFATDPEFFSTLTKTKPDGKHLIDWHAKDLKTGRERLRKRILELSRLWQDVETSKKAKGRKV